MSRESCARCCCCAQTRWRTGTAVAGPKSSSGCSTCCACGIHPVVPGAGIGGRFGRSRAAGPPRVAADRPRPGRGGRQDRGRRPRRSGGAGLEPLELEAKEGLALLNGTQQMTAIGVLALLGAEEACSRRRPSPRRCPSKRSGNGRGLRGGLSLSAAASRVRQRVAAQLRGLLRGSELMRAHHDLPHKVQDPYSIRCVPQVHGAVLMRWPMSAACSRSRSTRRRTTRWSFPMVRTSTLPRLRTGGGRVISGGNFHGEPVALAMDMLAIARG